MFRDEIRGKGPVRDSRDLYPRSLFPSGESALGVGPAKRRPLSAYLTDARHSLSSPIRDDFDLPCNIGYTCSSVKLILDVCHLNFKTGLFF